MNPSPLPGCRFGTIMNAGKLCKGIALSYSRQIPVTSSIDIVLITQVGATRQR